MARLKRQQVLAEVRAYRRGLWDGMRLYAELRGDSTTAAKNIRLRTLWDSLQAGTFDDEERARERRGNDE